MKKVVVVMKPILVFLSFFALALTAKGKQDTIYYRQAVTLENAWFSFVIKNGVIILRQDSVIFDCKKENGKFSFSLAYNDIRKVRRYSYLWAMPIMLSGWCLPLSHGVKIKTKSGDYYFFTFKRKKIMEIIRSKIAK